MLVYKITNLINGKVYVGQTKGTVEKRWRYHNYDSSRCRYLHNAIQKYGKDNFRIEQIDTASSQPELNEKEKYWIEFFDCISPKGYNLKSGGHKPKYSQESRERMSKNHPDVSGERNPRYGVSLSESTREKISKAHTGKKLSELHKQKVRQNSKRRKSVLNLDTKEVFLSSREAEETYKLAHGSISRVCRGEGKSAGGFHWKYESEVVSVV